MVYKYEDFVGAVNEQMNALAAVGNAFLNSNGQALIDAEVKISAMAEFYSSAQDFLSAVNLAEELDPGEYEAARFVIRSLERVARSEAADTEYHELHESDFIRELRDADTRCYNDLVSLCVEAANRLESCERREVGK